MSKNRFFIVWKIFLIFIYFFALVHFLKDITQDVLEIPTVLDVFGNIHENLNGFPEAFVWVYHWAMVNPFFVEFFLLVTVPGAWKRREFTKLDAIILVAIIYVTTMFFLATYLDPRFNLQ